MSQMDADQGGASARPRRRRRWARAWFWLCAVLAVGLTGMLVWSYASPRPTGVARRSLALRDGGVEFGWASHPFRRDERGWSFRTAQPARILLGRASAVVPTTSGASVNITLPNGTGATAITLRVLFVPIWPWAAALTGVSALLFWRSRRIAVPGHCGACGYDVRGLPGSKCPECGSVASLILAILKRWRRPVATG